MSFFSKQENCKAVLSNYLVEKMPNLSQRKSHTQNTLYFVFCGTYYASVISYFTQTAALVVKMQHKVKM